MCYRCPKIDFAISYLHEDGIDLELSLEEGWRRKRKRWRQFRSMMIRIVYL